MEWNLSAVANRHPSDLLRAMQDDHLALEEAFRALSDLAHRGDAEATRARFTSLENELRDHLAVEERQIFPLFAQDNPDEEAALGAVHARLRMRLEDLGMALELHTLRAGMVDDFIDLLHEHSLREPSHRAVAGSYERSPNMEICVSFPGEKRVAAQVGRHVIETDQPEDLGGHDSAPAPFDLFLASIATCAGIYVLGFLQARKLPTEGVELIQHVDYDATSGLPTKVRLELTLPPSFPEKYRAAIVRAAESCKVKKTIAAQPVFEVVAVDPSPKAESKCPCSIAV